VEKKPKPTRPPKSIPWEEMRATYLAENRLTLRALARRYGVAERLVHDRAAAERWRLARQEEQRRLGEVLLQAAREKIAAKAGAQTLSFLEDLARLRRKIAERYLEKLSEPEIEEQLETSVTDPSLESPIAETVVKKRRAALNLPRFAAKVLETELEALKAFTGIASGRAGLPPGSALHEREVTVRESVTIDLGG